MRRPLALAKFLAYDNKEIIARYQRDYPLTKMPAEQAFLELMKFIWLSATQQFLRKKFPQKTDYHFSCVMHAEMEDIDNMWHTFLLYTKDYYDFCRHHLHGEFFHHVPQPVLAKEMEPDANEYIKELERYLIFIEQHLGEETLASWFETNSL